MKQSLPYLEPGNISVYSSMKRCKHFALSIQLPQDDLVFSLSHEPKFWASKLQYILISWSLDSVRSTAFRYSPSNVSSTQIVEVCLFLMRLSIERCKLVDIDNCQIGDGAFVHGSYDNPLVLDDTVMSFCLWYWVMCICSIFADSLVSYACEEQE